MVLPSSILTEYGIFNQQAGFLWSLRYNLCDNVNCTYIVSFYVFFFYVIYLKPLVYLYT